MVTLAGTQSKFDNAVKALIELEYDAIEAYKMAINKLKNLSYKAKLEGFLIDHKRHISDIKHSYTSELHLPDSGSFIKGGMAKLKVVIANALGSDKSILKAMLTNEKDTNTAYERINHHPAKPSNEAIQISLRLAYEDEKRHKAWLESETSILGSIG